LQQNINGNKNTERMIMHTYEETTWYEDLSKVVHAWVNPQETFLGYGHIEDANDGSGDGILTFPEGMCEKMGWNPGDNLNLEVSEDGNLIISKIS
jgi:hypothetical protein